MRPCTICGQDELKHWRCEHFIGKKSVSKKKSDRNEGDTYITPDLVALAIVQCLREIIMPYGPGSWVRHTDAPDILEPSAGLGAFVRASRQVFPSANIHANELDPTRMQALVQAGADTITSGPFERVQGQYDLIIGNPPFSLAEEHTTRALGMLRDDGALAMLLKIGFLGSIKRLEFWGNNPPSYLVPIVPRPSFSGGGNDSNEYGVFVWQKHSDRRFRSWECKLLRQMVWKKDE